MIFVILSNKIDFCSFLFILRENGRKEVKKKKENEVTTIFSLIWLNGKEDGKKEKIGGSQHGTFLSKPAKRIGKRAREREREREREGGA